MNRNYFKLTKEELWFLFACRNQYSILGLDEDFPKLDEAALEKCLESLKMKKYIENELLDTWIWVINNARTYVVAKHKDEEKILIYFYKNSIVSLYIINGECELIWIPFINIAIGQTGSIISEQNYKEWKFECKTEENSEIIEYILAENEKYIDAMNGLAGMLVKAHGIAISGKYKNTSSRNAETKNVF